MAAKSMRELLAAKPQDGRFRLAEVDPASTPKLDKKLLRQKYC